MENKYITIDHPAFKSFVEITKALGEDDYFVNIGDEVFASGIMYEDIITWLDKDWVKPFVVENEYELLQDYSTPTMKISKGVIKTEYQWMSIFKMQRGDCYIKTDWFKICFK